MSYRKISTTRRPRAAGRMSSGALALLVVLGALSAVRLAAAETRGATLAIAIHGGAGTLPRDEMSAELEAGYRASLGIALDAGYAVLERGGSSLDAVTAAVKLLEDDPLFNAGKGAVLNHEGAAELDASIMDGRTLAAGAVAGLRHVRNPIELARTVMEKSPHVMLIGSGAEEFALEQGIALVPNEYFKTEHRRRQLDRARAPANAPTAARWGGRDLSGTVGAVALDSRGNLAAATSTGGMTGKRFGRVGDSPIIGAGTYANDRSCAVSATGHGEYFIRAVVAHDICALAAYRGWPLEKAVKEVVHGKLRNMGGEGGVIAVDRRGAVALDFNSEGMFRAARTSNGRREIAIYRDR
jgi:beta-aspartyl-peptidase (threonine type)